MVKKLLVLSKEFLDTQATIECGFTLKRVLDMVRTYSQMHCTDQTHNTDQSFGKFDRVVDCSFKNLAVVGYKFTNIKASYVEALQILKSAEEQTPKSVEEI